MRWVTLSDVYIDKSNTFAIDPKQGECAVAYSVRDSDHRGQARRPPQDPRVRLLAARDDREARPTCRCASRSRCCSSTRSTGSPAIRRICSRPTPPAGASACRSTAWSARPRPTSAARTARSRTRPCSTASRRSTARASATTTSRRRRPMAPSCRRSSSPRTWPRPPRVDIAPVDRAHARRQEARGARSVRDHAQPQAVVYFIAARGAADRRPSGSPITGGSPYEGAAASPRALIRLGVTIARRAAVDLALRSTLVDRRPHERHRRRRLAARSICSSPQWLLPARDRARRSTCSACCR